MNKRSYEEVSVGEEVSFSKTITEADVWSFGAICGDFNPVHMDENFAKGSMFKGRIAHGMLTASLIDYTLTGIMGAGGIHISQEVKFLAPVKIGDSISVLSKVVEKITEKRRLVVESVMKNQEGRTVLEGKAVTMMPN
ncbi:MAG: MaoC family dehydratase [Firmicutes bacterium]|nr:MaoC family dehydratase [Bacillota bacterium]